MKTLHEQNIENASKAVFAYYTIPAINWAVKEASRQNPLFKKAWMKQVELNNERKSESLH